MKGLVVADSGPLIIFARTGRLKLLQKVAGKIVLPETVLAECVHEAHRPGAQVLLKALREKLIEVRTDPKPLPQPLVALGPGERAALALALELRCPILLDDRLGRQAAQSLELEYVGSLAVLLAAKKKKLLKKVKPVIDEWQELGYFISKGLKAEVLKRAGEKK